jgi:hypothetical protein
MLKLLLCIAFFSLSLLATPTAYSEISNFFTPYGFRMPLLEKGQYTLNFNPHYYRQELGEKYGSGFNESISKQYGLSLKGIYALTDKLIFQSNLILYPGQTDLTYSSFIDYPYYNYIYGLKYEEHSNPIVSPGLGISFRPQANIQLYGDFRFSKKKSYLETEYEARLNDTNLEEIYFDLGFTLLGGISPDRHTKSLNPQIFDFVTPYGFMAPMISQGQYALNLGSQYTRTESYSEIISDINWEKNILRKYYFWLSGLYAVTEKILIQGKVDIYPEQTCETSKKGLVGKLTFYNELSSDFTVSPNLVLSLRPKPKMEIYGDFLLCMEKLNQSRESSQNEIMNLDYYSIMISRDYYCFNLGYTVLFAGSLHNSGPTYETEFSNFFTPSGFRTPLLKQGQGALNVKAHYSQTDLVEHYPPYPPILLTKRDAGSTIKRYYFSFNGPYAFFDCLIIEGGLDVFPGLTNITSWEKSESTISGFTGESKDKQHTHVTISPHFEVCYRPRKKLELYGTFSLNKENLYKENQLGAHIYQLSIEGIYFNLGLTILGAP